MDADARDEIEALGRAALRVVQDDTCRATPPGYNVPVYCDRPQGHQGRHWCDIINWPAS